ncbi:protein CASP-like [Mytilus galloprovincialis]|uniref:protein CASP-like n=1 Tax=Mytilus galloprovincialis TaxID=29158 RepID=UPI003F7BD9C0
MRGDFEKLEDKYKNLQVEYQEAVKTAQEQKQLITQLEEDLRSVNALSSMFRGTPEGQNVLTPGGEAEMVAEVVKDVAAPVAITIDPASKTAADSLLPIIQSQRERYRLRAQELEAQTLGQQQQVSLLQNEIDKLRSDNVKLYEKIRFLQSYPQEKQRRYMNLKPYDKITLSMVLYKLAHTESCKRDMAADWHEKYADHMMKVHGHADKHG